MELLVEQAGDVKVVIVKAELIDGQNSREFKDALLAQLDNARKVVLDLQHVQFLDSSGCGALLTGLKRLSEVGGDMKLCCVTSPVRALFDLVRIHRIMEVCKTRDEAVQAFAKK